MKKIRTGLIKLIALILSATILSGCSATSSTAEKSTAGLDTIESLVRGGNYEFTIRSANPSGGRTIQISSYYSMKVKDGTYEAYLPYFGRAYSGGYGDEGGVEFSGKPDDLQITRNDSKKNISVTFSITTDKDRYKASMELGASGYGNLMISSERRQSISYYGLTGNLKD